MNNFLKNVKSRKFAAALAAIFLIGALLAYGVIVLGGPPVWKTLAKVLPLPTATVDGYKISPSDINTTDRLGAPEPLDFAIRQTSIKALAKKMNLSATDSEIEQELNRLPQDWEKQIKAKNVNKEQFISLYIEPQILKEKLAVNISKPGSEVETVKNELLDGEPFEQVAEKYSDDQVTAVFGGDLGYVSLNDVDKRLWVRATGLKNGQWTGPITTPDGFVFLKRILSQPAKDGEPEKLNLRVIVVNEFDFEAWLSEQMKNMEIKVYING